MRFSWRSVACAGTRLLPDCSGPSGVETLAMRFSGGSEACASTRLLEPKTAVFPEVLHRAGSSRASDVFESELRGWAEAQHGEVPVASDVLGNEAGAEGHGHRARAATCVRFLGRALC